MLKKDLQVRQIFIASYCSPNWKELSEKAKRKFLAITSLFKFVSLIVPTPLHYYVHNTVTNTQITHCKKDVLLLKRGINQVTSTPRRNPSPR